jgi:undecaprenyl-diphosphatase
MISAIRWVGAIDARDRGLLDRLVIDPADSIVARWGWIAVTQLGSAGLTIGVAVLPPLLHLWPIRIGWHAGEALAASHLLVQLVKRSVHRARPPATPLVAAPDRFSFPSGHATASLAVATVCALAFPILAIPLLMLGLLVGWSRVVLGVHYPGDVIAGQLIALGTVVLLRII